MFKIISIILMFLIGNFVITSCSHNHKVYDRVEGEVNIAEYAKVERGKKSITLQWEEPRNIYKVVVKTSDPSELLTNKLQYWQNNWPQKRIPEGEVAGGRSGWIPRDDWFNGKWKDADTKTEIKNNSVIYTFNPVNDKEFPGEDFDANYRMSLKARLLFENNSPEIEDIQVYSNSVWKETEVKIEWGNDMAEENWHGHFEIYNGELKNIEALADNVKVEDQFNFRCDGNPGSVRLTLRYTYDGYPASSDITIVTLRSPTKSFSFFVNDVVSGEKLFVKDYDILVTKFADHINYAEFKQKWEAEHVKTLYDRIKDLPEQTFENAENDMPKKKERGYMPLGCEGGRQKFAVDVNGDVFWPGKYVNIHVYGNERHLWVGNEIRYSFGFPDVEPAERFRKDGYLPVIHTKWKTNEVVYEQTAFVTLLSSNILSGKRMQGDDPTILLKKVTLTNTGDESKNVTLNLKSSCGVEDKLVEKDGFVFATNYKPDRIRYFIDIKEKGLVKSEDGNLSYQINLAKNESHSIYFKIPFFLLFEKKEYELAKNADYDTEFLKVEK